MRPELSCKLGELPDLPGIYIFTSDAGEALYVGKAKSLRRRAAAYRKPAEDPRIALMLHDAADVEFVVTDSEAEALLFENNWIKRRQPRFNIRLRDDKTYPYLKLTLADGHPRLAFTRRIRRDGAEYYGPYLPAGLARKAIKLTQKLFGIRVCRIDIDGSLPRPCLYHDMKRCLGPCVDGLTTDEAYADAVEKARLFLAGRNEELLKDLRTRMRTLADELEFEAAARLRDTIHEIDEVSQRRKLSSARGEDVDIFGVHTSGDNAAVTVLVMRGGQVLDRRELFWEGVPRITAERLLSELLPQLYDRTTLIPKEIHLPAPIEGEEALIEWLSSRRESRVYLRMPSRGPKAQRIALANRNAAMAFRRRFRGAGAGGEAGAALRKALDLADPPRRIEGFDISTFGGSQTVASLVVWNDGRMVKGAGPDPHRRRAGPVERRARSPRGAGGRRNARGRTGQEGGGAVSPGTPRAAPAEAEPRGPAGAAAGTGRGPPLRRLPPQTTPFAKGTAQPLRRPAGDRAATAEVAGPPLRQFRRRRPGLGAAVERCARTEAGEIGLRFGPRRAFTLRAVRERRLLVSGAPEGRTRSLPAGNRRWRKVRTPTDGMLANGKAR